MVAWLAGRHQQRLQITAETLERLVAERTRELAQRTADLEDSLTTLRETQATLVVQEKMASLGELVAGVAHEINTPIGVALTGATMLSDRTRDVQERFDGGKLRKSDFEGFLSTVTSTSGLLQSNIERAAALVQTFKQVSADRTSEVRRPFELHDYLDDVLISLSPAYRKAGHEVILSCPKNIEIDGYPGAFAQILSNFVMNSLVHGFTEGTAGRLQITVNLPDPESVELIYTDNGKGISPDHHIRVFDPFFTTRRGAGCTGLGLHIVYNLVTARLGGEIRLDSADDGGARFTLRFPRLAPL
jgi:signal transduction histidine kinase